MTLPASLQSIRSLPQLLALVGSVDANHDGYLQPSEAKALFLPEEQLQFLDWYSEADSQQHNQLKLFEIAETMRRTGPTLNKLFSTQVIQYLEALQDFKDPTQAYTPLSAAYVNEWTDNLQLTTEMLVAATWLLNGMSMEGREGQAFCRRYIDELSPASLFLLLALAGKDLWSRPFAMASRRLESIPNLKDVVAAVDPQGTHLSELFLSAVTHGRDRHYLSRIKDLIYTAVTQTVHTEDVYLVPTLLPALKALASSSRETADQLGETLLRYHDESGDRRLKMGFQFVLWSLRQYWRSPEVKKVAQDPTALVTPPVPDTWLADGVLWAAVVFDSDQKVHRDRLVKMLRQEGFSFAQVTGDVTVKEKDLLEKVVNGVTLRVSVMYAPNYNNAPDYNFYFSNVVRSRADIVSIRAHHSSALYYLKECHSCQMANKLVFNGGCEGAGNVPELMRAYRGNLFIADKDIGKGHDNSLVLYHVMRAIAGGARGWGQVHRQVKAHVPVNQWGLLLPDDDVLRFYYTLDLPVHLPYVQDPLARDSSWGSRRSAVTTPRPPKGKRGIQK